MKFSVTILGSNSAFPTSKRFPTAHVLNAHERFFLIDCGEGTQLQIRRNKFRFGKINHIFISHLHGDHYFGIFGLISTMGLLGRKSDLHIFAMPDLETILEFQLRYFYEDLPYKIIFHPLQANEPELIYEDKSITVESFPLKHRIPTCGFLFREKKHDARIKKEMIDFYQIPIRDIVNIKQGADFINKEGEIIPNNRLTFPSGQQRSYAFCSDTAYSEKIVPVIQGVDLLYHEATFLHEKADQAKKSGHSTSQQAAQIAKKANVKKLIIGHYSSRYKDVKPLVDEARTVFRESYPAIENESWEVPFITRDQVEAK
ncbi:MAG: ribonuclease Z [Bacteroidales bacterium]|nr:ribonuclease Z [Bacteroidales bacterium]MCF8458461.1 ribonuclease Z [Bacteroidales bacterium]